MVNYKKVEGAALVMQGICEAIISETDNIKDDAHEIPHQTSVEQKAEDIFKSYEKISIYLKDLQRFHEFLGKELELKN